MPGVYLGPKEKVKIAQALAEAGIHNVEAGFPACGPSEIEAVKEVAGQVHGPIISAFCRTLTSDIDLAIEALAPAEPDKRGISLFVATSTIHRQAKLHKTPKQLI
ncbi:MAG: pyruvate carboxyltransferase, partial [Deltaproteobacteria bacterium]|nr:pyruvate carboxyltransferase [Deltaproteobacteria bacterium]